MSEMLSRDSNENKELLIARNRLKTYEDTYYKGGKTPQQLKSWMELDDAEFCREYFPELYGDEAYPTDDINVIEKRCEAFRCAIWETYLNGPGRLKEMIEQVRDADFCQEYFPEFYKEKVFSTDDTKVTTDASKDESVSEKLDGLQVTNTKVLEAMLESNKLAAEANKIAKQALLANARETLRKQLYSVIDGDEEDFVVSCPGDEEKFAHNSYVHEAREAITCFMKCKGKYLDKEQPIYGFNIKTRATHNYYAIADKEKLEKAKSKINNLLTEAMGKPPVWKLKDDRHIVYYA